jgi:TRAP transporter TAXI family solute receptor
MMTMTARKRFQLATALTVIAIAFATVPVGAQVKTRLSIATGGTGGVYYPLGGGLAALMSKYLPGVEATAEVTTASIDNMKLLHGNRIALAFTLPDTAWEAYQGQIKGFKEKVGVRALAALIPTTCTSSPWTASASKASPISRASACLLERPAQAPN